MRCIVKSRRLVLTATAKSAGSGEGRQANESELVVLGAIAVMMSKMGKADGLVTSGSRW